MFSLSTMFSKATRRAAVSLGTLGRLGGPLSASFSSSSCCFCSCLPSTSFASGISFTPQFVWCLQQMATFAFSHYCSSRKQCRLTLPASPSSPHHQQIVLYQPPAAAAAAAAAAAPRPNQQAESFALLVANVASLWIARIRLVQEIQEAGRKRLLDKEAQQSLKKIRHEALQLLLKTHRKKYSRLSRYDKYAIEDYTGSGYGVINRALRSGTLAADEQARVNSILRAMSKTIGSKVFQGTVYRGTKLPSAVMQELRTGDTFCDPAFLSSSVKKEKAFVSKCGGSILFEIVSKTGVNVSRFSRHKEEAEILFRPSTMFKIKAVESGLEGVAMSVKMEELF